MITITWTTVYERGDFYAMLPLPGSNLHVFVRDRRLMKVSLKKRGFTVPIKSLENQNERQKLNQLARAIVEDLYQSAIDAEIQDLWDLGILLGPASSADYDEMWRKTNMWMNDLAKVAHA